MRFTPEIEAAIRADFHLGRVLDDVLDDPFAADAEQRLQAAADQAHEAATIAGVLGTSPLAWLELLRQHPDYPMETHRHRQAVERRQRPGHLLNQMESAVRAGDGASFHSALGELKEIADRTQLIRWMGGAL